MNFLWSYGLIEPPPLCNQGNSVLPCLWANAVVPIEIRELSLKIQAYDGKLNEQAMTISNDLSEEKQEMMIIQMTSY